MKLAIGQYDAPQIQKQPILYLDPYRSNIAIFGAPMSGKTTLIKTMLVRLHENMEQAPGENIYLIDFGGNIGSYGKLRNVCACFDNTNEENIKRVFRTIEKRLADNAKQLDSQSYYSVVTKTPEKAPTHIFLIIENINAFLADERYASYQDKLIRFCRDGLSKGLTVVITANETAGINRLLSNFGQKYAFEMPNESYYDIFGAKVNKPMKLPGRGIANIDAATYEFQCFLPFPTRDDDDSLAKLIEKTAKYPNDHVMAAFSEDLTWDNYLYYCAKDAFKLPSDDHVVVGLDYYEHKPVAVNIAESRSIAIYGKRKFGKSNLLQLLLNDISKSSAILDEDAHEHMEISFWDIEADEIYGFILTSDGLDNELYRKGSVYVNKAAEDYFNSVVISTDPKEAIQSKIAELTAEEDSPFDDDISIAVINRATSAISFPDDPTWLCTCGERNRLQDTYCYKCGKDFSVLYQNVRFKEYGGKTAFFLEINKRPDEEARVIGLHTKATQRKSNTNVTTEPNDFELITPQNKKKRPPVKPTEESTERPVKKPRTDPGEHRDPLYL